MRRLDDPAAAALAELMAVFDDLQTVLRCCERLVAELAVEGQPDAVVVEAVWATALLSYARCFSATEKGVALSEDDLTATQSSGKVLEWHQLLLQLRNHYANPTVNPREQFSVGVAQDANGTPSGVAITSARQPLVDELTVRQTGAIAYALSGLVNERIESRQHQICDDLKKLSKEDLAKLDPLDVVAPTAQP